MKKIISIICIGTSLLFLNSCDNNFLEKYPQDQISSETYWITETDATQALTGVYNVLSDHQALNHGRRLWDGLSEIAYSKAFPTIAQGVIESSSENIITSTFSDCYTGISRCNIFLDNVDKVEMTEATRTIYKGEVLFLRAYFYFTLTEFYGGVPLYTKPVTIEESQIAQSTKEAVVTQILADLDQAIANLPNTAYTGHAVKGSALALKAQVLMHNQKWAEAAAAANEIITGGKFSLYKDYSKMFLSSDQDNNPEIIFSVRYLNPNASMPTTNEQNADLMGAHSHYLAPTKQYVDEFECTDGLSIAKSPLYDSSNEFANRDPRLKYTAINLADYTAKAKSLGQTGESWETPYSCEKAVNWANAPYSWSTKSDQDYVAFRYAQVLLMYAECKNEASGPNQSVYDAVNLVRSRPGVNMPALPAGLDKVGMRDRIRHERIVELGMEGLHYWDIKRWKTAETIIPTVKDPGGIYRTFDATKHYLFPFPLSELDRNPNLKQNPGY
jgi:starch-binding outer membrane protein, SusD/RagB family